MTTVALLRLSSIVGVSSNFPPQIGSSEIFTKIDVSDS